MVSDNEGRLCWNNASNKQRIEILSATKFIADSRPSFFDKIRNSQWGSLTIGDQNEIKDALDKVGFKCFS